MQRARPVAQSVAQPHKLALPIFVQRVEAEQALGGYQRFGVTAVLLLLLNQLLQVEQEEITRPFPFGIEPGFVNQGQQVAAVELVGFGQTAVLHCLFKGGHVQPVGGQGVPLHLAAHPLQPIGRPGRQGAAQFIEVAAQIAASGRFRHVRPEGEGQPVAVHRLLAMQQQIGQ